ncbi:MAG TPA: RNA polymerase sigma factor [Anaerolineales bacterium]|jgi:RNA polymerase sigma-70 factor (ECF subfamily)|nr:RNA polymerase sigma factor [Anaerolineales bacterium]
MPDWQDLDEVQLIALAQDGEAEAFGELYERHVQTIFRFIYVRLDDRRDAEDLTEEVFLRVWQSLPNYREQGVPFLAFLFRIARNAVIDFYRSSKSSGRQESIEDSLVQDFHSDPGDQAITNLEHQELRQILDHMREDYRMVLVLRFLSELSPEETAQVMGRSTGAVRVLQHRALSALRNILEGS